MKNKFNLSKQNKHTYNIGELCVSNVMEVLPGDILRGGVDLFSRVTPLNVPAFAKLEQVTESFYVPDRLVWEDAEEFHSGGAYGSTPPVYPTIDVFAALGADIEGSVFNHMGLPKTISAGKCTISALPLRKLNLIYNHFFRHDELNTERSVSLASGTDTTTSTSVPYVNYRKDYFVGAQVRQAKASQILVDVERLTNAPSWKAYNAATDTLATNAAMDTNTGEVQSGTASISMDPMGGLVLNASEIRDSQKLLNYYENAARRGTDKYSDFIQQAFGVSKQDMRLADPIKLSYASDILKFTEIIQSSPDATTGTTSADGVGKMKGHGMVGVKGRGYKQFILEHGHVITVQYVRPTKVAYMDGIERMWTKTLKEHFFQPELAHMSQQAIKNREVYANSATPTGTFAWQDIYEEYRHALNITTGEFCDTLNMWHVDRQFASEPAFNANFIECVAPSRIFQDEVSDQIYTLSFHNIKALRPIPASGMPK